MKYKYLLPIVVGLLHIVGQLKADKLCSKLKPCGERGVCATSSGRLEPSNVLAIKCHCRYNYTGQWCHFIDGKYRPAPTGKVPAMPDIITDTRVPNYNPKYQLKFKGVRDPSKKSKVLYYLLRYSDITTSEGEWRSIPIMVNTKHRKYKVVLDKLDWGHEYKLKLYAGNTFGLSKPNKRKLIRPKVSEPRLVNVSKDVTGSDSDLRIRIHCKAEGTPEPTYSWNLNDLPLLKSSNVVVQGGTVTISQPSPIQDEGEFRCIASNAWGKVMSRPIKLNISEPVKGKNGFSHVINPHIVIYQGTTLTMNCGDASQCIKWFYNGVPIRKSGTRKNGEDRVTLHQGRLQLANTKPVATGIYQCDVRTNDSLITKTRYVHVRDFDHIEPLSVKHKTSDNVRLEDGTTATLTCSPNPIQTFPIIWKILPRKTDKRFQISPKGFLEVRDIRKSDSSLQITCESPPDKSVSIRRLIKTSVFRSVDGGWSKWASWQPCREKKCLGHTRYRQCNNPAPRYDGKYCPGPGSEKSGVWSSWTSWSCVPLQGKCGKHHKVRTRSCQGDHCLGERKQSKSCKDYIPCPVDGFWTPWSSWSACTKQCYPGGTTTRSRRCKPPKHGGKMCKGRFSISKKCNSNNRCPINGGWTAWSPWTECSASCNGGTKSRDRKCTNPKPQREGLECDGMRSMTEPCNTSPCKVDGGWSAWSDFSACSVTCGAGVQYSTRTCNNPPAKHGGKECEGNSQYRTQCDVPPCKVNGSWSTWSAWSECSTTCGVGIKSRVRNCTNPPPQGGGEDCVGKSNNETSCNSRPCEVHGRWSSWSEWSSCSVTCGSGVRSRVRSCTNPAPKYGGKQCPGKHEFEADCHRKLCEGEPSEENVLSDMKYIHNKSSSSNSLNAILYIAIGGCSTLLLIALLFCFFRFSYVRSLTKSYMPMVPLTKIKTKPVVLKSILKSKKRRRKIPDGLDIPNKSTKRSNTTSDGSEIPSKSAKHGSLPPSPALLSNNATSSRPKRKRRAPTRSRKRDNAKKEANTSDEDTELEKNAMESVKAKDIPVHKMSKDSKSPKVPRPPVSSSISRVPTAITSDKNEKSVVEPAGEMKDTTVPAPGSATITERSLTADDKIDLEKCGKTNEDTKEGQKMSTLEKDPSSSSVIKESSKPPSVSSGPSAVVTSKSSKTKRSSSVCRSMIEFENAILETGDVQRMKSTSQSEKSED